MRTSDASDTWPAVDVLYVGTLPPHPGGSAISAVQILGALARHGSRVRAVGPHTLDTAAAAEALAAEYPEIEFHRYPVPYYELIPDRAHGGDYRAAEKAGIRSLLPRLIAAGRPDVIFLGRETYTWHLPEPDITGDIPCLVRAAGGGVNGLVAGLSPDGFADRLRRTHMQVVPGRHMISVLQEAGCANVRFIENVVDLERFRPGPKPGALLADLDIDPGHLVVSHVSNLKAVKRPADFVEAAATVREAIDDVTFLMVGDGALRTELEELARRLGVIDHFRFTGWVDYAKVPDLLLASDIVVMCSRREGLARVYLETMACERLLVSSDIPPAREVVEHGRTGLLYPLGDVAALAQCIVSAAGHPQVRARMSAAAREAVRDHSLDVAGAAYARALRELADCVGPGRSS